MFGHVWSCSVLRGGSEQLVRASFSELSANQNAAHRLKWIILIGSSTEHIISDGLIDSLILNER
jgi:hypothetical protein